jgi:hypothetical protein
MNIVYKRSTLQSCATQPFQGVSMRTHRIIFTLSSSLRVKGYPEGVINL